ncbi:fibronectin type III domain-containing protein [Flavobacterium sp.]|uniref:RCC1 domain-containing protein n=1 Tax=Flavobacterium sp. TaxID=239 RepID=UPI00261A88B4|nr:fibronectin type III domain-containing protein [Flavobacterium sp.]
MKKRIILICLLAFLYFIPSAVAQCTTATNGLFPSNTFTPACNGNYETITSQSWTGEYSNVNVIANKQYSFSSSVTTDYITITNATGTVVYASGTQPVIWDSGSITGGIRYYLHSNATCGSEQVVRSRYIRCADASNCVAPSNLTVTNITSNSCKMTWTAASPVPPSNYDIYIVTTNNVPNANTTPTLFSTTNLTTSMSLNVAAGTTYYYWIRSNCGATTGTWISGGSFTTPPALTCNGAIYGLYPEATFTPACTGTNEQIVTNAYAGEYSNVNVLTNRQYTFTSSISTDYITITNATGTTVLANGLTPLTWLSGTTSGVIRYHLNTNSSCGTQNTNRVKSITCATITSCNAPTQLFFDPESATVVNIAWTEPNPAPSNGYVYCYSTVNDPFSASAITGQTSNTFAVLNNLTPNTTYYFWVKSNCGATQSNWASGGSFTTATASGCSVPTQLFFDPESATVVNIAWTEPNPAPSNGYVYCYSTVNDPFSASAVTGQTSNTFAVLNNLTPNTTYYFWVKSNCGATQSSWASGGSFTTAAASATCFAQLSCAALGATAIKSDGSLWAWGNSVNGSIGDGANTSRNYPVQIGNSNLWQSVSQTAFSGMAIKTDGTLWGWGQNIGNINSTSGSAVLSPIQIGTSNNWQSVSAGTGHTMAIKTNGTLWGWGSNGYGQSGVNDFEPTQLGTDTWISVSAGYDYTLAIKSNGTLWAWGYNNKGQLGTGNLSNSNTPIQIGTTANWSKVVAGNGSSFAIKTDGTLWAWGDNQYSQLGDGTTTNRTTPVQIGTATNWQHIGAGGSHAVGKKNDGTIWAWGINNYSQLGNGSTTSSSVPVQIGSATDWLTIDAGVSSTSAIKTDGTMYVWGRNNLGQLGDGTYTQRSVPTAINCPSTSLADENFELNKLKIYPNPTDDILNISLDNEITTVSIFNLIGQEILSKSVNNNQTSIDISNLSAGTYLVKVSSGNEVKTIKVVKN